MLNSTIFVGGSCFFKLSGLIFDHFRWKVGNWGVARKGLRGGCAATLSWRLIQQIIVLFIKNNNKKQKQKNLSLTRFALSEQGLSHLVGLPCRGLVGLACRRRVCLRRTLDGPCWKGLFRDLVSDKVCLVGDRACRNLSVCLVGALSEALSGPCRIALSEKGMSAAKTLVEPCWKGLIGCLVADKVCLVGGRACRTLSVCLVGALSEALSGPCRIALSEKGMSAAKPLSGLVGRALSEALSRTRFLSDTCFEGCLRRKPLSDACR